MSKISTCAFERNDPPGISPLFNQSGEVIGTHYNGKIIYDGGQLYRKKTSLNALAGSSPNRLSRQKGLTEMLYPEEKVQHSSFSEDIKEESLSGSTSSKANRLTKQKSLSQLLGAV